jgi:sulfatase maturation enzyme AslB (radical SAM superfamily)
MTNRKLPPRIHVPAKPTTAICNLNRSHCFSLIKELPYPISYFRLGDHVQERYIRQLFKSRAPARQGGEHTLAWSDIG